MTYEQQIFIDKKVEEINSKLKNVELTEQEKQVLIEERTQYEEEFQESEESEEVEYESVYFKYWFEGCKTIDDVLCGIQGLKQTFEQWKKEGHELTQPVDTGYCFIDKVYKEQKEE